jgi:hypothetical protein
MHLGRRLPAAGQWQVEIALQDRVIQLFRGVCPSCSPRLGCLNRSLTARTGWESELRSKAVTAPLEIDREFCKRCNRRCASRSKLVALRNENGLHCAAVSERGRRPQGDPEAQMWVWRRSSRRIAAGVGGQRPVLFACFRVGTKASTSTLGAPNKLDPSKESKNRASGTVSG